MIPGDGSGVTVPSRRKMEEWFNDLSNIYLHDPVIRGGLNCCNHLRSYQAEALRNIFDEVMSGKGNTR